jgi:hypothetical protein
MTAKVNNMTRKTRPYIGIAAVAWIVAPGQARANMSYSPWVYEIVQRGADEDVGADCQSESGCSVSMAGHISTRESHRRSAIAIVIASIADLWTW